MNFKDGDEKEDHIFAILGNVTINGVTYRSAIQNCASPKYNYEVLELEDYVRRLQKGEGKEDKKYYINAWGIQPAFAIGD